MSKLDELLDGKNWGIGEGAEGNSVDVFYGDDYRGNFLLPEARAELAQLRAELEKRHHEFLKLDNENAALRADLLEAVQMVALAAGANEHGWKEEYRRALHDFLGAHLDVLTGDGA